MSLRPSFPLHLWVGGPRRSEEKEEQVLEELDEEKEKEARTAVDGP